jgi:hypothetical protein
MIPEAVFHELPAKTLRKLAVSDRNPPENARNSSQESGNRIRLSVLTHSCRFLAEPDKSGHRIRLPECCFHEICGIPRNRPFPCRIVRPGLHEFLFCLQIESLSECLQTAKRAQDRRDIVYAIQVLSKVN